MTDQAAQVLAVGVRVVDDEALQGAVAAFDQAVAPALQGVEALVVLAGGAVELVDQGDDGLDILLAHELADVLEVPFAGNVRLVLRRFRQGPLQGVGQRQLGQHVGLEGGQALAEVLQGMQLALDLGFALLSGEVVVEEFRHGGGPMGNAAMITSRGRLVRPGWRRQSAVRAARRPMRPPRLGFSELEWL
ncbi:hypothetical protein D9M68_581590 [compost metagenome]